MDYIQKIYILKIYMYIVYIQYVYKLEGTADFCIRGDNTLVLFVFNLILGFFFFLFYICTYVCKYPYVCMQVQYIFVQEKQHKTLFTVYDGLRRRTTMMMGCCTTVSRQLLTTTDDSRILGPSRANGNQSKIILCSSVFGCQCARLCLSFSHGFLFTSTTLFVCCKLYVRCLSAFGIHGERKYTRRINTVEHVCPDRDDDGSRSLHEKNEMKINNKKARARSSITEEMIERKQHQQHKKYLTKPSSSVVTTATTTLEKSVFC